MSIKISKCEKADLVKIGEVYDKVVEYLDAHKNYPKWTYKEYPSYGYAVQMYERGEQYKIEKDGVIIGAFVLNTDPAGNYAKVKWGIDIPEGEYFILHALAIDYDYARQGIGKKVIEFCKNEARSRGIKAVRVDIVPDNAPAQNLYESCGFVNRGIYDLDRGFEFIPLFTLFEYVVE